MGTLWSPEETKQKLEEALNATFNWHLALDGRVCIHGEVYYAKNEEWFMRRVQEEKDSLYEELHDVLNMNFSSSKVRQALLLGLQRTKGVTLVLGPGGCGKSLIYKAIAHCTPHCLCMAPTGVAAYNLASNGWGKLTYTTKPTTIHSALGLSPRPYFYPDRNTIKEVKKKLVGKWEGAITGTGKETVDSRPYDMILIDEISMVSPNLLDLILTAAGELNIPVMLFGDPMQLRPVEVDDKNGTNRSAAMLAGAYPGWNFFDSYVWMSLQSTGAARTVVLDSVYRQSDPGFKSLLNRMRINEPTEADWTCLESRVRDTVPEGSLILCKRNSTVDSINEKFSGHRNLSLVLDRKTMNGCNAAFLETLKSRYRVEEGEMSERDITVFNVLSALKPFNGPKDEKDGKREVLKYNDRYSSREETKGLVEDLSGFSTEILLYPGDRVMVTKNCSTSVYTKDISTESYKDKYLIKGGKLKRIVNGMLGWYLGVLDEKYCERVLEKGEKPPVLVLLDTDEVAVVPMTEFSMEKINSKGEYYTSGTAMQYPLRMAYAITYHKSQGLTLEKVHMILEGDNSRWKVPGLAYLGLSRCKTLEGLTIEGLSRAEFLEDKESKDFMKNAETVSW